MKRVFVFLLVGMLLVFQPIKAYAEAGTVAIVGGSIATGGLSAAAFGSAALTGPAVVIVFAALIAAGMNVRLTQASQEAGMTKTEFLKSKIQSFCNEANITLGVFNKTILEDAQITKNGLISLGSNARKQIVQLGNWLFQSDQVQDPTAVTPSGDTITLGGYTMPYTTVLTVVSATSGTFTFTADEPVAWFLATVNNRACVCACLNKSTTIRVRRSTGSIFSVDYLQRFNNVYGIGWSGFYNNQSITPSVPTVNQDYATFLNSLDGTWNPGITSPDDSMTGKETDWTQNKDRIMNPGTYLNPGLNPGLDIPQDRSISIDIPDYLDAIGKILDGVRNPAIPGIDDATHMPVDVPYDDTVDPAPTIDDPPVDPVDPSPVIDPSEPASPDLAVAPFEMDLKGLFPFCIPFDVVDMLKMLKADPVAPSYTVNWNIPIINQTLTFTIDLTPFNGVASILRTMEIIAFCIGLAFVTRSMFIRG